MRHLSTLFCEETGKRSARRGIRTCGPNASLYLRFVRGYILAVLPPAQKRNQCRDSADTAPDCPYNQIGINRRAEADDRGDGIEHHEGNAPAAAAVSDYNRNNTSCNQEQSDE